MLLNQSSSPSMRRTGSTAAKVDFFISKLSLSLLHESVFVLTKVYGLVRTSHSAFEHLQAVKENLPQVESDLSPLVARPKRCHLIIA